MKYGHCLSFLAAFAALLIPLIDSLTRYGGLSVITKSNLHGRLSGTVNKRESSKLFLEEVASASNIDTLSASAAVVSTSTSTSPLGLDRTNNGWFLPQLASATNIDTIATPVEIASTSTSTSTSSTVLNIPPIERKGFLILILLFLVVALCALDRVAMSVAILPMGAEFQYSDATKGLISSIFSLGYMVGLVPSGLLGTFSSPKSILAYGVLLWSLAQIVTPFAAYASIPVLLFSRFCMGMAEAVAIPTVQTFIARWVPEYQRSIVLGLVLSGLQIGNVCAYLASPTLLDAFNWNGLFIVYGAAGFLWLALWLPVAQDNPALISDCAPDNCSLEEMEEQIILEKERISTRTYSEIIVGINDKLKSVPWRAIVSNKEIKAIAVAHAVQNFGLYINLAWLPSYFNQIYHLGVTDSSLSAVLPWVTAAVVGSGTGFIADKALQQSVDKTLIRKVAQTFSLVVPAITLLLLSSATELTANEAIAYFTVICASAAACVAGFGSSVQDVCKDPKLTSTIYSITSGVILDSTSQDWDVVFRGTACVYFLGAAYYASNYEARKLF